MIYLNKLLNILKKNQINNDIVYEWHNAGYAIVFEAPNYNFNQLTNNTLISYQRIILQTLLEQNQAKGNIDNQVFISGDILSSLDNNTLELLNLPDRWKGKIDIIASGLTNNKSFRIKLLATPLYDNSSYDVIINGPLFSINNIDYTPNKYLWIAIDALYRHQTLTDEDKTQYENLKLVHSLQYAAKSLETSNSQITIDLRRFSKIFVHEPDSIGLFAYENDDGSISLVPNFYVNESGKTIVKDIEERISQLNNNSNVLKIHDDIIVLDDNRLKAVNEILTVGKISAKDKIKFFNNPSAFINASLVNLDNGFSLRVHGAELFQKAYFGLSESGGISWFDDANKSNFKILGLEDIASSISTEDELNSLKRLIDNANKSNQKQIDFNGQIIQLPASNSEVKLILDTIYNNIVSTPNALSGNKTYKEQIVLNINKNDEILDHVNYQNPDKLKLYKGSIELNDLNVDLFDYQKEGVRWLLGLMNFDLSPNHMIQTGGLLADDMGLGKTFMVLTAINIYMKYLNHIGRLKPILAVMPVVLLQNWKNEIDKLFKSSPFKLSSEFKNLKNIVILQSNSDLNSFRIKGTSKEITATNVNNDDITSSIRYSLKVGSSFSLERLDIPGRLVLTNYETLRDYQFSLCQIDWGFVIFDEAQEIKNSNSLKSRAAKALKSDFKLAVTGTPVENSLSDFWTIYDTILPGLLGSFQDFRKKYINPIKNEQNHDTISMKKIEIGQQLRKIVGYSMLRRTKEDELQGLPKKFIHNGLLDNNYSSIMNGEQLELYNSILDKVIIAKKTNQSKVREILLPSLRQLQLISIHPYLINSNLSIIKTENINDFINKSEKLKILINIINEVKERNEKMIIFAINRSLQFILSHCLSNLYNLRIDIINGQTKTINKNENSVSQTRLQIIKHFESEDGFNIIIMSPLAAGVGITVTGANNVVHLERHWNPAKEAQATDRVYRIGQSKDVHIYYPIILHPVNKSFDQNLNELLINKTSIRDSIITNDDISPVDFDATKIFGTDISDQRIKSEWLSSLDWKYTEALAAFIARCLYGGTVYLTSKSNDHGADVILEGDTNLVIQCKQSNKHFNHGDSLREPLGAKEEYSAKRGINFNHAILCINAPSIDSNIYDRAKSMKIKIWDMDFLNNMLSKFKIRISDLEAILSMPRLKF